jgi:hypothetical protein
VPIADEPGTENVIDWLCPEVRVNGPDGCAVTFAGNPESVSVALPVNPFIAAKETEVGALTVPNVVLI